MKTKLLSYLLYGGLAISLVLVGKLAYTNHQLDNRTNELNDELMQADLELGRAKTEIGDVNQYVKTLEEGIQAEIKEREAVATRFADFKASVKINKPKTKWKTKTKIVYKDKVLSIKDDLNLPVGGLYQSGGGSQLYPIEIIPFGYSDHRLTFMHDIKTEPGSMELQHYIGYELRLKLEGKLIETKTKTGAVNHYLELYSLDKNNNKENKFNLERFNVVMRDFRVNQMHWWAPHLDIGLLGMVNQDKEFTYGGTIGLSFMGYGKTKNDLLWRFGRVSFDLIEQPGIGFSPAVFNIASFLPLFSNLWVAPHFTYGLKQDMYLGFTLNGML